MMAKRNGGFALLVTLLTAGFWANQAWMINDKPELLKLLRTLITIFNPL